jgi:hypothetical protein
MTSGAFGDKFQPKMRIGWELFGEDEDGEPLVVEVGGKMMPMVVSKTYTISFHEKSNLRKELQDWRGKKFSDEELGGFDIAKLLGQYCMVNISQSESKGKTYANVSGLTPLPSALKASKPTGVHKIQTFDFDDPDMQVFATLYPKLQETIKNSPEWAAMTRKRQPEMAGNDHASGYPDDVPPDDIPF